MVLAQSRGLIATMPDVFRYFAGFTTKILGNTYPSDGSALTYTLREPLGVVGAIIPWNSPAFAFAWKVAPALACGNTVVLKPAEQAPLLPLRLAELLQAADLPPGVLNVVPGFGTVAGDALAKHPDVNKINFTGSTGVGKSILAASASNLKKVTLELGGKSPNIIFPDADLEKAIPAAVMGFAAGAGQICVAGTRIFIHEAVYDEVAATISKAAKGMKVGDPLDPTTAVGPIISKKQLDRVSDYIRGRPGRGRDPAHGRATEGWAGLLCPAHRIRERHRPDAHRARGDLRARRGADPVQGRERRGFPRQRHLLRPSRRRLDQRHVQGPLGRPRARSRHRLDQHYLRARRDRALWRL